MKKAFSTFLFLFISTQFYGQSFSVVDSLTEKIIPYVNIVFYSGGKFIGGTYSDQNGRVKLDITNEIDSVELSCLGYEKLKLSINNISDKIYLHANSEFLNEVIVTQNVDAPTRFIGYEKDLKSGATSAFDGMQYVVKIENPYKHTKRIKSFVFYIRKLKTSKKANARIIFFENEYGKPGKQMPVFKVISLEDYRKQKIEIDFTDISLALPAQGFFAGIEWMGCIEGQDEEVENSNMEKCVMSILINNISSPERHHETFVRSIFKSNIWIDFNDNMQNELFLNPAFGIYVYE